MSELQRIVVVGSAIPIEKGSLEQRQAAAFRRLMQRFGEVLWAVADVDGTQIASRSALQRDMFLTPLRPASMPVDAMRQVVEGAGAHPAGIAGLQRLNRFVRRIAAFRPDLIVIDDPVLAGLGENLRSLGARMVLCDGDALAVHRSLVLAAADSVEVRWHALYGEEATRRRERALGLFDQVWKTGSTLQLGGDLNLNGQVFLVPRPSMGIHDERLHEKVGPVVVVSSGLLWLDKLTAMRIAEPLAALAKRKDAPGVILVGFRSDIVAPLARFATIEADWKAFGFHLGRARFLLASAAGPATSEAIKTALVSGTPVLIPLAIAQQLGFDATPGIFTYDEGRLAELLGLGAFSSEHDTEANAAIAAEAEVVFGAAACAAAAKSALEAMFGVVRASSEPAAALKRHLRVSPLAGPPVVLFNPATRMLLVRVRVLKKSGVNEIRVWDADGVEITRILASEDASQKPIQDVEGGIVLPVSMEFGDLVLGLFDDDVELFRIPVGRPEIVTLEAELVALELTDTTCEGVFWAAADGTRDLWQIALGGHRARADARRAVRMKGLDLFAVPFSMLRTQGAGPGAAIEIGRVDLERKSVQAMAQRPATVGWLTGTAVEGRPHPVQALKDIHRGKRGWMLGNGPSVRLSDLDAIPDDDVKFAFNRFHKCYGDTRLREDYVVSADMLMIDDFGQEMVDRSAGLPLFCRHRAVSEVSGRFVELTPGDTFLPLFSYDPSRFVSIGGSSVFVAMQMAYYMGIRELFLYGMDFSFTMKVTRDPRYKFPVSFDDNNHFIKGYRDAKPWCPPTWRDISAGFLNARAVFELGGGRIRNATRGGKLEIFERVAFEEAAGAGTPLRLSA